MEWRTDHFAGAGVTARTQAGGSADACLGRASGRDERLRFGEAQLRRACAERGLDWDRMSEDERESIASALLHEK